MIRDAVILVAVADIIVDPMIADVSITSELIPDQGAKRIREMGLRARSIRGSFSSMFNISMLTAGF